MPDKLNLSFWIRGFGERNMLRHFEQLLGSFPFSRLKPGISAVRIYAIEESEPPVLEEAFTPDTGFEAAVEAAQEFENPDCEYIVDGFWELWQYESDWTLSPARVSLLCFGPQFDNDVGDHLRIELGDERLFLVRPEIPQSARMVQSNLQGVVRVARELEAALPVEKRQLWSDSGENFAERLEESL